MLDILFVRPKPNNPLSPRTVYVQYDEARQLAYFGVTRDIAGRRSVISRYAPDAPIVFCKTGVPRAFGVRRQIHDRLAPHRVGGNWFAVSLDLALAAFRAETNRFGEIENISAF